MPESILIKVPEKYKLNNEIIQQFSALNPDIEISLLADNTLQITESTFLFHDYELIELKFPTTIFTDSNFDELYEINTDTLNFEQPGNHSILIKMGTTYLIGLITSAIIISLGIWLKKTNKGKVVPENTEYQFENTETGEKTIHMADVSFMDFNKVSKEEQQNWKDKAQKAKVAPTLCIEIVSAKYGLKPALKKMKEVWMKHGTDIGVVVCPFSKQIYIFEKGISGYREQSIFIPFTHPLLPGYEGNFGEELEE